MAEGERDSFIENDVIGNYNVGTSFLGGFASRRARKKSKKHRGKSVRRRKRRTAKRGKRVRHSKSSKGIRYTKNGQPYKILANGRARFIKGRRKK